ncbi:MAG TPA: hypothetical protein PLS78_07545 [bacterium]|jgi:hypothetical protein|nr:hypothetical protein [bacterium]
MSHPLLSVVKYNIITKNCQNNEKTEALIILALPKILQGEKMKKLLIVFLVLFFVFTTLYAKDTKQKQSSVEKSLKNQGEISCVDTKHFIFTIKDDSGTETKFFISPVGIKTIAKGDKVSVVYRQTTDGNLKALSIKPVKEKKSRKKTPGKPIQNKEEE